jgi:hypothetical protein
MFCARQKIFVGCQISEDGIQVACAEEIINV